MRRARDWIGSTQGLYLRASYQEFNTVSDEIQSDKLTEQIDAEVAERLRTVRNPAEQRTLAHLLREIGKLPLEQTRAALEVSATIAGVSLRASIEFLRAVPDAARILEPAELRAWGELGRRVTMADVEAGISFFIAGTGEFSEVPP